MYSLAIELAKPANNDRIRVHYSRGQVKRTIVLLVGFACLSGLSVRIAYGQSCDKLNSLRSSTYNFHPAKLSSAERNTKSREMDSFWTAVKEAGPRGIPCLKQMLDDTQNDPYFVFDGSSLLLSLAQDHDSFLLVQRVLPKTSLDDVDIASYVRLVLHLSIKGADIGPLAHKYLIYPNVDTYLPEHGAMKLDRLAGATLLYGSMPPDEADKDLSDVVKDEKSPSRDVAAEVLALNMTDASFRFMKSNATTIPLSATDHHYIDPVLRYAGYHSAQTPEFSRERVVQFLQQIPNFTSDFPGVAGNSALEESASNLLTEADLPLLREARRKSIQGVSDESLDEYFALSTIMLNVINRLDLYADFRSH